MNGDEESRGPGKERPVASGGQQDRPGFVLLSGHWLTRLGLFLVITAISTWIFILPSGQPGHGENPYKGLVVYVVVGGEFLNHAAMGV